ncbi:hypothetical protein [Paenibacillus sp. RC67]|uniref:hypothetical protein n=1 Tax=Paenibacillus sp. RC67 TaxID=3039392 RepID=UPI0024ACCF5F|nr:hypothetical protein [Paenibacillus sp. RC67]
MKRWIASLILLLSLLGLIGCSRSVDFNGKSEFWSVNCSVNLSSNEKSYAIEYIGKESQPISKVYYAFESSKNFNSEGRGDPQSRHLVMKGKGTMTKPYEEEKSFKLRIQWNGKEETITVEKK